MSKAAAAAALPSVSEPSGKRRAPAWRLHGRNLVHAGRIARAPTADYTHCMQRRIRSGERELLVEAPNDAKVLQVLRAQLGLQSVTWGCRDRTCGSCRVLIDGALIRSCTVCFEELRDGAVIETLEHVADLPQVVQTLAHFAAERASRCSLCVGSLGVCAALLAREANLQPAAAPAVAVEHLVRDATCQCTGRASLRRSLLHGALTPQSKKASA
jgi:aerobic carbon-monoxide dehydrogenase small subunit